MLFSVYSNGKDSNKKMKKKKGKRRETEKK
jgi:hypothetical protein